MCRLDSHRHDVYRNATHQSVRGAPTGALQPPSVASIAIVVTFCCKYCEGHLIRPAHTLQNISLTFEPPWPKIGVGGRPSAVNITCETRLPAISGSWGEVIFTLTKSFHPNEVKTESTPNDTYVRVGIPSSNPYGRYIRVSCSTRLPGCRPGHDVSIRVVRVGLDHFRLRMSIGNFSAVHGGPWHCTVLLASGATNSVRKYESSILIGCTSNPSDLRLSVWPSRYQGGMILEDTLVTLICQGNAGSPLYKLGLLQLHYDPSGNYNDHRQSMAHLVPHETVFSSAFRDDNCRWNGLVHQKIRFRRKLSDVAFVCAVIDMRVEVGQVFPNTVVQFFVVPLGDTERWLDEGEAMMNTTKTESEFTPTKRNVWEIFGVSALGIMVVVAILESIYCLCRKARFLQRGKEANV